MSRRTRWTAATALAVLVAGVLLVGWRSGSVAARPSALRPTGAPTGAVEEVRKAPPPRIHPFARQPRRTPRPPLPSPTGPTKIAEGFDGCDRGYGENRGVCVPWQFPPGVRDRCAWLAAQRYPKLRVINERDRHGLDRNRDGVACGPGD